MADLQGGQGELRAVLTIKRAATGKVEQYDVVGRVVPEQADEEKEQDDGGNALDRGA